MNVLLSALPNATTPGCTTYDLVAGLHRPRRRQHHRHRFVEVRQKSTRVEQPWPMVESESDCSIRKAHTLTRSTLVRHCDAPSLVPPLPSPAHALLGSVTVMLAIIEGLHAPLLDQVAHILTQLHTAQQHGMVPSAFLGASSLVPAACTPDVDNAGILRISVTS